MSQTQFKMIISDLDGTLVRNGSNEISGVLQETVTLLKQQGFIFTIATGRAWFSTRPVVEQLQLDTPVIIHNGAMIFDPVNQEVMTSFPIRSSIERALATIQTPPGVDRFYLNIDGTYSFNQVNTVAGKRIAGREESWYRHGTSPPATTIKHLFTGAEEELKQLMTLILTIRPRPNLVLWPPEPGEPDWYMEVFDPLASKGQGVKILMKLHSIRSRQIVAFGDGYNDRDLLQMAGWGIAIAGSPVATLTKPKFIIPGPEEEGIPRFLTDKVLLKYA
jgi:Cof subfamily protein (haloacid dehalogenase superfamily)